eukprot:m.246958 g.246958  ORF g.246958 m.246958 type:complete len:343 (-) comp19069_c0_seq19:1928-2956(-)
MQGKHRHSFLPRPPRRQQPFPHLPQQQRQRRRQRRLPPPLQRRRRQDLSPPPRQPLRSPQPLLLLAPCFRRPCPSLPCLSVNGNKRGKSKRPLDFFVTANSNTSTMVLTVTRLLLPPQTRSDSTPPPPATRTLPQTTPTSRRRGKEEQQEEKRTLPQTSTHARPFTVCCHRNDRGQARRTFLLLDVFLFFFLFSSPSPRSSDAHDAANFFHRLCCLRCCCPTSLLKHAPHKPLVLLQPHQIVLNWGEKIDYHLCQLLFKFKSVGRAKGLDDILWTVVLGRRGCKQRHQIGNARSFQWVVCHGPLAVRDGFSNLFADEVWWVLETDAAPLGKITLAHLLGRVF